LPHIYFEGVTLAGGIAVLLPPQPVDTEIADRVLDGLDGLVITGGKDVDPARYGQAPDARTVVDPGRDALDEEAFRLAYQRGVPIFGICRGLQAINVFSGGSLMQHVDDHASRPYRGRAADASRHAMRLVRGSTLSSLLGGATQLEVNSFHHQAVDLEGLAPGLRASGIAPHASGDLVEALESEGDRWLLGVQCHPERTESTPAEFERLWDAFIAAARGRVSRPGEDRA
jgi:putative glutamine amidotransferase